MDVELATVRRHLQVRLPLGLLFGHLGGISLFLLGAKVFLWGFLGGEGSEQSLKLLLRDGIDALAGRDNEETVVAPSYEWQLWSHISEVGIMMKAGISMVAF